MATVLQNLRLLADPSRLRRAMGVAADAPVLLIAPGSRPGEIERLTPSFEAAAQRLKSRSQNNRSF